MERIESTHSIWLFDVERMRFRRVPKGTDPNEEITRRAVELLKSFGRRMEPR